MRDCTQSLPRLCGFACNYPPICNDPCNYWERTGEGVEREEPRTVQCDHESVQDSPAGTDALATMLTPEQVDRVKAFTRWREDFALFCREVLGYRDMIRREDEVVPGYSHDDVCHFLQHDLSPRKLLLMPRYSFKSCLATMGFSLWSLVRNENLRILFYSDVNEKAEGFLEGVKTHLLGSAPHSIFRAAYGAWEVDSKTGVWNQREIVIRPRTAAQIEPSIDTAGLETSKVAKHYDLIIFDDLVSDKNVTTPDLIQKVKDTRKKALSLLRPGGQELVIGTRWHFGDLYGELIAQEEERAARGLPKVFSVYLRQAEVGGRYPFAKIGLTQAFLAAQRLAQGSYTYSALYQNCPTDADTQLFRLADFRFYDPPLQSEGWRQLAADLYITAALDPAAGTGNDRAALTVCGTDAELNLYLLDIVAGEHLTPEEQIAALFDLHAKWGIQRLAIETNGFQKMLKRDLEYRYAQERKTNPRFRLFQVQEMTGTSQNTKDLRIRALQPYHERGALRVPGTRYELLTGHLRALCDELLQYPHAPHDDLIDSLAYHIPIHRAGGVAKPPQDIPEFSIAWIEREEQRKASDVWGTVPRWARHPVPQPAFS